MRTRFHKATPAYYLKSRLKFIALLLVLSCGPNQGETKTVARAVPNDWTPSLEQVQQHFQEAFNRNPNKSQQALNRAAQTLADLVDARLFITYIKLIDTLEYPAKVKLFDEQKEWLSTRADKAQAAVTSKHGSLERLEYSGTYRQITEERLAELEKRLMRAKNKRAGS